MGRKSVVLKKDQALMRKEIVDDRHDALLSPRQLSLRHQVSEKKLAHDRLSGRGVPFIKCGRLCRYRLSDVLLYEQAQLRRSTSDQGGHDV